MYCEFYQLSERPFNVTPDPKFLYLNARYREALASLNYGITQRKGFITLIGEAGTGKTTLLNKLLEDLDQKTKSVFIFNTNVTFEDILEYIFAEFDLPVHNGKKLYMLQRLNSFLLDELRGGGNVALLIDEAQDLEFSVLEDLRLLSNLETAKEKILQIVLSGQPELGQKLSNPILRQLRQRIGINCRLLPLSRDEISEYIQYRLQAAGCPDLKLFSREAEEQIYHFSRGIPRLVNVVCDNALVIGYALGKKRIGADVVTEAAADLLPLEPAVEEPAERPTTATPLLQPPFKSQERWRGRLGVMSLIIVAVIVGLLSVGRTMLRKHVDEPTVANVLPRRSEVIKPGSQPHGAGVQVPPVHSDEADAGTGPQLADDPAIAPPAPVPQRDVASGGVDAPDRGLTHPAEGSEVARARPADLAPEPFARGDAVRPVEPPDNAALNAKPAAEGELAAKSPPQPERADHTTPQPSEAAALGAATAGTEGGEPAYLDGVQFGYIVVHPGDSLYGIVLRKYGQASPTIMDLVKLANPDLNDIDMLSVGQEIRIPELGEGFPILNDGAGHYALLLYSTSQPARAAALQNALRSRNFEAQVSDGSLGAQKPLFRVVISGFTDRDKVVGAAKQLQKLFREDTRLAQLGE